MDKYKVIFKCEDGYEFNEFIYAKNESMAIEVVKAMGYFEEFHDVVNTTCLLIGDKEWDDNVRDNYDYVGEICPHCNNEVFIHPKMASPCPKCGEIIVPCSTCFSRVYDCCKCPYLD